MMRSVRLILCLSLAVVSIACGDVSDSEQSAPVYVDAEAHGEDAGLTADAMMNSDGDDAMVDEVDAAVDGGAEDECVSTSVFVANVVWPEVIEPECAGCHVGVEQPSHAFSLVDAAEDGANEANLAALRRVSLDELDGASLLLLKISGEHPDGHGEAERLSPSGDAYGHLAELAGRLRGELDDCGASVVTPDELHPAEACEELAPGRRQLRRLSHSEYSNTVGDLVGVDVNAKAAFVADPVEFGFDNHPELLAVQGLLADQYRRMAESIADRVDVESLLPCDLQEADLVCGHRFIAQFGARAYRRPLTSGEVTAYRRLFSIVVEEECYEQAVRWVVTAMLQSPHFLYRTELGRSTPNGFELTAYELASQLSYLIWGTMPDQDLFDAAEDGSLLDPEELRRQTARLLHSPRSTVMVSDFVGKWLGTEKLMHVVRDAVVYADLDLELRQAMLDENRHFVSDLWRRNRPYTDFFEAKHSWLSPELAAHYGQTWTDGPENEQGFRKLVLDDTRPAGLLSQGAFLTTHASPTSSSPIMRGLTVRGRLLCQELPLPPFAIPELPEDAGPDATTRERFAAHTDNELCQGCHQLIDPLGFGFEHYDGIGRYREMDGTQPIDASGSIVRFEGADSPFHGVGELAALLADDEAVKACFSRQWLRYGIGESESFDVECHVEALTSELDEKDSRLKAVIKAVTRLPHFRRRTGEAGEDDVIGAELIPSAAGQSVDQSDPAEPPAGLPQLACGQAPQVVERAEAGDPRLQVAPREDRWDHGYCQYFTLTNVGEDNLSGWAVRREVEGTISNTWGALRDADSGTVTFISLPENERLEPGQQAQFGFCASL